MQPAVSQAAAQQIGSGQIGSGHHNSLRQHSVSSSASPSGVSEVQATASARAPSFLEKQAAAFMAESRGSKQANAVRPAAAIAKKPGSRSGQLQTERQLASAGSASPQLTVVDRQVTQPRRNGAHWMLQQNLSTKPSNTKFAAAAISIKRPCRPGSEPPVTLSRNRVSESSSESSLDG